MAKPSVQEIDRQIGQRLKKLRLEAGLNAAELAEKSDSTQQQISRYETGRNKLSAAQLFRLASALGVPVSWFFLDLDIDGAGRPSQSRPRGSYDAARVMDELDILKARWPQLLPAQRVAVLRLLDSF